MADVEKQEFLSPHQCFVVYDDLTKQIAISVRNRLSEKGVKCVIWDDKQFKANEARLSNFNRLLIFNKKIADEYLGNPSLKSKDLSEYVAYRQEGRVASICLKNEGLDYADLYKQISAPVDEFKKNLLALEPEKQEKIKELTNEEIAEAIAIIEQENNPLALPAGSEDKGENKGENNRAVELLKEYGLAAVGGAVGFLFPIPTISALVVLTGYGWFLSGKDADRCKKLLLFEAAENFEKELLDDFVNAK